MNDETLVNTVDETQPSIAPSPKTNRTVSVHPIVLLIAFFLLASGMGYGYWLLNQQDKVVAQLQQNLTGLADQLSVNAQLAEQFNQYQKSESENSQQIKAQLNELQMQVLKQGETVQQFAQMDRQYWQIEEALYFLNLANQQVVYKQSIDGVATLLAAADRILQEIDDQRLHDVRKKIAEELVAVRTVPAIDREGIYLRIAAVAKQANQLSLTSQAFVYPTEAQDNVDMGAEKTMSWINRFWQSVTHALSQLDRYVRITHKTDALPPSLAPEQENFVRRTLQLQFEQAQLALLMANQQLYAQSLQKAKQTLLEFFLVDKESADSVIRVVDELLVMPVQSAMPLIGVAQQLLKSYAIQRQQMNASSETSSTLPEGGL